MSVSEDVDGGVGVTELKKKLIFTLTPNYPHPKPKPPPLSSALTQIHTQTFFVPLSLVPVNFYFLVAVTVPVSFIFRHSLFNKCN